MEFPKLPSKAIDGRVLQLGIDTVNKFIPLKQIEFWPTIYPRKDVNQAAISTYAGFYEDAADAEAKQIRKKKAKPKPPLPDIYLVAYQTEKNGVSYIALDGRHRYEAKSRAGQTNINAVVDNTLSLIKDDLEKPEIVDYLYYVSALLNSKHGVRLEETDKKTIVQRLSLAGYQTKDIIPLAGSQATAYRWIKEIRGQDQEASDYAEIRDTGVQMIIAGEASLKDAARLTGISPDTLKVAVHRERERIKKKKDTGVATSTIDEVTDSHRENVTDPKAAAECTVKEPLVTDSYQDIVTNTESALPMTKEVSIAVCKDFYNSLIGKVLDHECEDFIKKMILPTFALLSPHLADTINCGHLNTAIELDNDLRESHEARIQLSRQYKELKDENEALKAQLAKVGDCDASCPYVIKNFRETAIMILNAAIEDIRVHANLVAEKPDLASSPEVTLPVRSFSSTLEWSQMKGVDIDDSFRHRATLYYKAIKGTVFETMPEVAKHIKRVKEIIEQSKKEPST